MILDKRYNGASIIALAWPDTKVRRIGVWYDQVTQWLGFINGDYYKAGHAAAVLVDHSEGALQYFDFGRYHTPEKMGRLRSQGTDPELKLLSIAKFDSAGEIANIDEILGEIAENGATHGQGVMYAALAKRIDGKKALQFTMNLQRSGMVHYGPFDLRGTNCSRFVRDIVKNSTFDLGTKTRLTLPWTITPATKWVVCNTAADGSYFKVNGTVSAHHRISILQKIGSYFLQWLRGDKSTLMHSWADVESAHIFPINERS